jgi:hypothetical protein
MTTLNKKPTESAWLVAVRLYSCLSCSDHREMPDMQCLPEMLVTQWGKERPGLADGMMDDKGEERFAKQMTKTGIKGKCTREERRKSNTLAKIDENSVPCLDGVMMSRGGHHAVNIAFVSCRA